MVYCRHCQQKVEDCQHFVPPIRATRIKVFDPKVETLAYDEKQKILEIGFKSGQVWQLTGVPPDIYTEIQNSTISGFLKFIAHRYNASPVRRDEPEMKAVECSKCGAPMTRQYRTGSNFDQAFRLLWSCAKCKRTEWRQYIAG
jgi:hypothetical protein